MKRTLNGRLILAAAVMTLMLLCCAAASAAGVLHIPEDTTRIESQAFADVKPTYVDFPAGIQYIASDAFGSYTNFTGRGPEGTYAETWCRNKRIPYVTTKYYALLIGNGTGYYDEEDRLEGIPNDISAMQTVLNCLGQDWQVTVRENRTASQMLNDIQSTFSGKNSSDVFLFYYSGHGDNSIGSSAGSLVGVDYSWLYPTTLASYLNTYTAGRVIVLLDSCGSGSYVYPNGEEPESISPRNFTQAITSAFETYNNGDSNLPNTGEMLNTSKFSVLAACAHGTTSLGGYIYRPGSYIQVAPGSVFTYSLVRSLGFIYPYGYDCGSVPADANGDGKITLAEAYNGINSYVVQMNNLAPDYYRQLFYERNGYLPTFIPEEWTYWSDQVTQIAGRSNSVIFSR